MTLVRRFRANKTLWPTGLVEPDKAENVPHAADHGGTPEAVEAIPASGEGPTLSESSTHAELDEAADALGVTFPKDTNKADKLAILTGTEE